VSVALLAASGFPVTDQRRLRRSRALVRRRIPRDRRGLSMGVSVVRKLGCTSLTAMGFLETDQRRLRRSWPLVRRRIPRDRRGLSMGVSVFGNPAARDLSRTRPVSDWRRAMPARESSQWHTGCLRGRSLEVAVGLLPPQRFRRQIRDSCGVAGLWCAGGSPGTVGGSPWG
jgi:hypothetical protein